jgi:hypothetical protein
MGQWAVNLIKIVPRKIPANCPDLLRFNLIESPPLPIFDTLDIAHHGLLFNTSSPQRKQ